MNGARVTQGTPGAPGTPGGAPPLPGTGKAARPKRRSPLFALLVIVAVAVIGGLSAAVVSFIAAKPPADPAAGQPQDVRTAPSVTDPGTGAGTGTGTGTKAAASGAAGNPKAPTGVRLRDDKTSVTLNWTDPSQGTVPFIVAGGQQGALRQLQAVPVGVTTVTIYGLNAKLEYCFTVAAVYGTNDVQLSDLTCTRRA